MMPESVVGLISYANAITGAHSIEGKYLFANETTDGKTPASPDEVAILKELGGTQDVFGKAYGLAAGTTSADAYGNARPFQTEPTVSLFVGRIT
jgi:hypothetical protein